LSQEFVERLFSVCGMLTVGRCNRMDVTEYACVVESEP